MRFVSLAVMAATATVLAAPGASAQYHPRYRIYDAPPLYEAYTTPTRGFYCVKSCERDLSPCDPPEFKRADGRCTSPATGGVR
ncbi:MAG: hypothetical protein KDJ40_01175 [Hyphomicrobiales bacterium]|nr:hypothetical protein [Hyphomicrobiales bacterium]